MKIPIKIIQDKIDALSNSKEPYVRLGQWFAKKDWTIWEKQIENDANAGRLDFLVERVMTEKAKG